MYLPLMQNRCTCRIDVGGKLLTNYLKELVSYRHWYMMDQTAVMEHAKEETCYVSTQWAQDWEAAKYVARFLVTALDAALRTPDLRVPLPLRELR